MPDFDPKTPVDPYTGEGADLGGGGPEAPMGGFGPSPGDVHNPESIEKDPPVNLTFDDDQVYLYTDKYGNLHYTYEDDNGTDHSVIYMDRGDGTWRVYDQSFPPNSNSVTVFTDPPYDDITQVTPGINIYTDVDPNDPNPPPRVSERYDGFQTDDLAQDHLPTWPQAEDENLAQDHLYPFIPDGQEENLGQDHLPPPSPYDGIEGENLGQDHLPPPWIEGEENRTEGRLPLPDTGIQGEEDHTGGRLPLPDDTPIQAKDNLAKGHLPGLVDEEQLQAEERARAEEAQNPTPPADPPPTTPQDEPPVDPNADRQPPEEPPPSPTPEDLGIQEHYAKDHGLPGLVEEPAAFSIPADPTLQATPPASQTPEAEPPVQPTPPGDAPEGGSAGIGVPYQDYIPFYPMVQDPTTGEWRNAQPGEIPGLGEESAEEDPLPPGTQTPEAEPPVQPPPPPGDPLSTEDLFNADAPGPTISRDLFDPTAPGETLDTGLIPDLAQNPQLAEKVNDDPDVAAMLARNPGMIEQLKQDAPLSEGEPSGVTDPTGVTDHGFTYPSLTEPPSPEPSTPEQDHLDDHGSL